MSFVFLHPAQNLPSSLRTGSCWSGFAFLMFSSLAPLLRPDLSLLLQRGPFQPRELISEQNSAMD